MIEEKEWKYCQEIIFMFNQIKKEEGI